MRAELANMNVAHERECTDLTVSNASLQSRLKETQNEMEHIKKEAANEMERLKKEAAQGSCAFHAIVVDCDLHPSYRPLVPS